MKCGEFFFHYRINRCILKEDTAPWYYFDLLRLFITLGVDCRGKENWIIHEMTAEEIRLPQFVC